MKDHPFSVHGLQLLAVGCNRKVRDYYLLLYDLFLLLLKTVPILLLQIKTSITCYNYILLLSHAFVLEKTPIELIRNWN